MDREEMLKMAKEAHGPITSQWWDMDAAALGRFAALIESRVVERCAEVCERHAASIRAIGGQHMPLMNVAAAIRALNNEVPRG